MLPVIEALLNDNATMVLGSAVATFNEVCPQEWNMVHRNFRKLCGLLADMDEWGQIATLHMLTRYCRTQFIDPEADRAAKKAGKAHKKIAVDGVDGAAAKATEGESDESSDDEDDDVFASTVTSAEATMDPDHRLLLRSALPLLQSRNTGVVLAVATLYHYIAPRSEHSKIAKSLIRVLRGRKEAKFVVLNGILTLVEANPDMFRAHLADFFIESSEPTYIRKIKIDIVTLLANEGNISRILREFKIYVSQEDKDFVKATIQAIGRCAMRLPEVTETCMHCLTSLIGTHSEAAVAESIVVIKKLLQVSRGEEETKSGSASSSNGKSSKGKFSDVIKHMAKLLDTVKNPQARASIAWIISEHVSQLQAIAPDVLRKLAKTFPEEDHLVKLQALNLGVKLYLTNPEQTTLLFQYLLNLAKYDTSYDLRDRARLIRRIVFNTGDKATTLNEHALQLFLTQKPVPSMDVITPTDSEGAFFFPGSISSILGHTAYGYLRVPSWATERSDPEQRNPIKREWENFAYGGLTAGVAHTPAAVTAISWNQVQNRAHPNATSFSSVNAAPGAMSPQAAHAVAGFASREDYERNFWGEDSSSDSDSSSSSGSDSDSDSSSSGSSSDSDSDSDAGSDDEGPSRADDDLFGTPVPAASPVPSASASSASPAPVAVAPVEQSPASPAPAPEAAQVETETSEPSHTEEASTATPNGVTHDEPTFDQNADVSAAEDFVPPTETENSDWLSGDSNQESLI